MDLAEIAIEVRTRLDVNSQKVRTTLLKRRIVSTGVHYHQMHVQGQTSGLTNDLDDHRTKAQVRYKRAIHDVDVNPIDASQTVELLNLFAQLPKIRRQNRRREQYVCRHQDSFHCLSAANLLNSRL